MPSGNLAAAADFFASTLDGLDGAGLEEAGQIVEKASKEAIGDPNNGFGWPPLASSTLERKAANTPLYDSGELKASIQHVVEGSKVTIGTASKIGVYQMLGTRSIPPRDFLRPAVEQNKDAIREVIGHAVVAALTGRSSP